MLFLCLPLSSVSLSAAWESVGPFGGSAAFVVADANSSKTFLAGTRNALLFRTNDAGLSWTPVPFPAQLKVTLNVLAIDPQTPDTYLAGVTSDLLRILEVFPRNVPAGDRRR